MHIKKKWSLIFASLGLIALLVVGALTFSPVLAQGPGGIRGQFACDQAQFGGFGPGWMMGYGPTYTGTLPFGSGVPGSCQFGFGGMMGMMPGGMMGGGMMGGSMMSWSSPLFRPDPLTLTEATEAVDDYLTGLNDTGLEVGEVMVFDNHAYAQIVETETGIGAMEVLVDPVTKAVYPEMGPNMMWNLKYGIVGGYGMMGFGFGAGNQGMMGRNSPMMGNATAPTVDAELPVSPEEAVEIAQAYLDAYVGNSLEADEHADPFYGYYTLHINRGGDAIGMLSVNGYTGQVFLHTWHGDLLEMREE